MPSHPHLQLAAASSRRSSITLKRERTLSEGRDARKPLNVKVEQPAVALEPLQSALYEPDEDVGVPEPVAEEEGENDMGTEEDGSEKTSPKIPEDKEMDNKSSYSFQNSPVSVLSNQEVELESRLSDGSDRLSDFKTSSPPESQRDNESHGSKPKDDMYGSLEKMRAAYASFLSESYWTNVGLDLKVGNSGSKTKCDSTNGSTKGEFDWHQDALSKTLQQTLSPKPASKPNLFSSVHLYRQSSKACGAVFTGASRFRCKDCSAAYDTLVELTVHMNKSGHYQDDNHSKQGIASTSSSKSRKRNLQDMEGKEDAQKVLKCMFCGHSFDSLQDLIPPVKKRVFEATRPCSPDSTTGATGYSEAQKSAGLANTPNNRYGYQNGASYTWQFETCKSQILKCMECGSSHDTLQQLTTHMMVTGHFIKVTNSASKKGKQLTLDPLAIEKMQVLAEPTTNDSEGDKASPKSTASGESEKVLQKEKKPDQTEEERGKNDQQDGTDQKPTDAGFKYPYLREEDLEQGASGGAYQLSGVIKNASLSASPPIQIKQSLNHKLRPIAPKGKFYQGLRGLESFQGHHNPDIKKERSSASDGKESQSNCVSEGNDTIKEKLSPAFSDGANPSPSPPASNGHSSSSEISSTPMPQKHALSDIADMVKVLPKATTPKPSMPSRVPAMKLESDVRRFEDVSSEVYSVHKRKGKYLLSDLGPQERMHISKFTGLSMTTISHWLANVKYQLRKTGGTKFLKNMDTGHPIKDMSKLPIEHQTKVTEPELTKVFSVRPTEALVTEEDIDSKFKCKLCSRTFASNHAAHLSDSKTLHSSTDTRELHLTFEPSLFSFLGVEESDSMETETVAQPGCEGPEFVAASSQTAGERRICVWGVRAHPQCWWKQHVV
ncbi:hypothetical protein P4O66_004068 [Electrophorus voltai]|uniref:C2H2-type domain-containing protein n=1 Tax=Electrophorus voltai TaxID=2609070 RepID=A0AAD9E3Q4_9TELE|nr:hypothetical protein P4O66_004068 [Electrophorus voltai]